MDKPTEGLARLLLGMLVACVVVVAILSIYLVVRFCQKYVKCEDGLQSEIVRHTGENKNCLPLVSCSSHVYEDVPSRSGLLSPKADGGSFHSRFTDEYDEVNVDNMINDSVEVARLERSTNESASMRLNVDLDSVLSMFSDSIKSTPEVNARRFENYPETDTAGGIAVPNHRTQESAPLATASCIVDVSSRDMENMSTDHIRNSSDTKPRTIKSGKVRIRCVSESGDRSSEELPPNSKVLIRQFSQMEDATPHHYSYYQNVVHSTPHDVAEGSPQELFPTEKTPENGITIPSPQSPRKPVTCATKTDNRKSENVMPHMITLKVIDKKEENQKLVGQAASPRIVASTKSKSYQSAMKNESSSGDAGEKRCQSSAWSVYMTSLRNQCQTSADYKSEPAPKKPNHRFVDGERRLLEDAKPATSRMDKLATQLEGMPVTACSPASRLGPTELSSPQLKAMEPDREDSSLICRVCHICSQKFAVSSKSPLSNDGQVFYSGELVCAFCQEEK